MATVRQYRGRWAADFQDKLNHRRIEVPMGNFESKALERRAALELLAVQLREVDQHTYTQPSAKLTFADVADRYLKSRAKASANTVTEYRQLVDDYLVSAFGTRKVQAISVYDIERYRDELRTREKPVGARTFNKLGTQLSMILGYAHKHGWVVKNVAEGVESLPMPEGESRVIEQNVLSPDELRRVIEHARAPYALPIAFATYTGARQSEILALRWSDLDWAKGERPTSAAATARAASQSPRRRHPAARSSCPRRS